MLSRRLFAAGAIVTAATPAQHRKGAAPSPKPAPPAKAAPPAGETTIERVRRTKVLRIAALPGEAPYFAKDDSGAWSGMGVDMADDIAAALEAKAEYRETGHADVLPDLQAAKIDLAFLLTPMPKRALVIDFTRPLYRHDFGIVSHAGFTASHWAELDKPEKRIALDIGSAEEALAHRLAPNAAFIGFKSRELCALAVEAGRADCTVLPAELALAARAKRSQLGKFQILDEPRVRLASCLGLRREADRRWRDFLDAWIDYNRGIGRIRAWLVAALEKSGVKAEDIPPDLA